MEKYPKEEHAMCHICLKKNKAVPAVHVCLDCSSAPRYFCDSCLETHNTWFEDHQKLYVTEFTEGKHQEMCSNHASEKATHVCTGCKAVLCSACETAGPCTVSAGGKHTCVLKHVYLERLRVQLHLTNAACVNNCAVLGEKIWAIGNWHPSVEVEADQVSKDIDSHSEDIIRKVSDLSSENKRKAQNLHEENEISLKKSLAVLTSLKESNAKGQRICQTVLTSESIVNLQAALDEVKEYQKEVPAKEMSRAKVRFVVPSSHEIDAMLRAVKGHTGSAETPPLQTIAVKGPHNLCVQSMFFMVIFNEIIPLASGYMLESLNNKLYQVDKKGLRTQISNTSIGCFCISHDRVKGYTIEGQDIYQYDLEDETGTLSGKMKYATLTYSGNALSISSSSLNQLAVLCGTQVLIYEHGELKQTVLSSSMGVQLFDSPTSVTWSTDGKKLLVADSTNRKVQTTMYSRRTGKDVPSTRTDVYQHVVCLTLDPPNIKWETQVSERTSTSRFCITHLLCMDEFIYVVSRSWVSTYQIYVLKADTGELMKNESGQGHVYGLSNNGGVAQVLVCSSL